MTENLLSNVFSPNFLNSVYESLLSRNDSYMETPSVPGTQKHRFDKGVWFKRNDHNLCFHFSFVIFHSFT
jgi:hypothetical protein